MRVSIRAVGSIGRDPSVGIQFKFFKITSKGSRLPVHHEMAVMSGKGPHREEEAEHVAVRETRPVAFHLSIGIAILKCGCSYWP